MITNPIYKGLARKIAMLFCEAAASPPVCTESIKQRIISSFNNVTFEYFLANLTKGRYVIMRYYNWRQGSNCRDKIISVEFIDVITGNRVNGNWQYISADCENKSYYWPDLNHLVSVYNHVMLDTPIESGTNADIGKPRLIYSPNATPSYNVSYIPGSVPGGGGSGGGGNILPKVPVVPPGEPEPEIAVQSAGFDFEGLLKNPAVLIGAAAAIYFLVIK